MARHPEVAAFLRGRKDAYDPEHVEEMQQWAQEHTVPFCGTCKDWHKPSEEHTED